MCGICGIVGSVEPASHDGMLGSMTHRGPDDHGTFERTASDGSVWFGHRRLSIIDLTPSGRQPMTSASGALTVTFNGEIYNYIALRDELSSKGHTFHTESDTEVILAAWEEWGEQSLHRLFGMFAFAIWDSRTETLWLARDRMGEKPVYYHATAERLLFASELRALLASSLVPRVLDPDGLESYLAYGSVTQPYTLVKGVRILGAGQYLQYRKGAVPQVHQYWIPPAADPEAAPVDAAEATARVREAIDNAIASCMVADVPIALLLSGGIDSTAILARLTAMGYRDLTSFNVGFEGTDATFDESEWAIRAAQRFGTKHHQVKIQPSEVRDLMRSALAAVDLPSVDGFNHYLAFQAIARAGFKVALTGQGADELFYGYARHRTYAISHRLARLRIPAPVRHGMSRAFTAFVPEGQRLRKTVSLFAPGTRSELAYASRHLVYTGEEMSHLLGRPVRNPVRFVPQSVGDTPLAQLYNIEVRHFLRNQLLRDGDQMSMAVSLELRAPFVDFRLVETVSSLPSHLKIIPGRQKPLLVDAIDDPLVHETARRRKFGFPFPLRRWVMEEINTDSISPRTLGFDTPRAHQVFARGKQGVEHMQAWLLSVLAVWMQENHIAPA